MSDKDEDLRRPYVVKEILGRPQEFALSIGEESQLRSARSLCTLKNRPLRGRQLRIGEPIYLFPCDGDMISAYVVSVDPGRCFYKGERTITIVAAVASSEAVA